jgi:hypothetical protein
MYGRSKISPPLEQEIHCLLHITVSHIVILECILQHHSHLSSPCFFFYSERFSYTHIHPAHSQFRRLTGRSLLSGSALPKVALANNGSKLSAKSVVANAI